MGFVTYLLVALIIFGKFDPRLDLGIGLMAGSLAAAMLAEATFAVAPSDTRLRRADRLLLLAVGACLLITAIIALADAVIA